MASLDDSAMDKMYRMVDKFENLCCGKTFCQRTNEGNFTNFTVDEILKPDFGHNYMQNCYSQRIADIVSSADELSDVTSESDDIYSSETEIRDTESPENQYILPSARVRKNAHVVDDPLFQYSYANVKPFNMLDRIRRHNLEEDGYSSSDSESALDLRIARKKTPPKNSVPAWIFCTRYSDRPSAGPRAKRRKKSHSATNKRNRIAFNDNQLHQLSLEFRKSPYLSEDRRQDLAKKLNLNETNVKIWFQNKRAKLKKETYPNPLALQLMQQGLYNHRTAELKIDNDNSDSDVSYGSTC